MPYVNAEHLASDPATDAGRLESLVGYSITVNRSLALHGNASEALLVQLSKSPDRITRRNVTLNPQTPVQVLLGLAPTFPAEFFRNPIFDLLLIEDPNLLNNLPVGIMKNILKQADCPKGLLEWAAHCGNKSHQMAVATRTQVDQSLLEVIAQGPNFSAAEVAAGRLLGGDGVVSAT